VVLAADVAESQGDLSPPTPSLEGLARELDTFIADDVFRLGLDVGVTHHPSQEVAG
jgi:hypothetical protein